MVRCYYQNGYQHCNRTAWDNWIRWLVLAVVVIGFLFLFMLCSCLTARRRRKAGRTPFYGTGWAARPGQNGAQPYYNNNQNTAPAPAYSASTAPNSNTGYYGNGQNANYYGQQNGVEMQPPAPTYGGYAAPPGPPPGKA
ncbi:hypothetical protein EJ02DRAFT_454316 [Clathrospora elynae]|uniref:Chitin synthesis regulation, congo red resistance, RCR protein n=1 Tax=Clathrospora elynae TaxID=706981 RepID=A0A6A5SQU4_9PLEO|nr:hypothetical protein EJ02DRAFT_454316 [Clathrospora elynae]